jgi:hypothetical protein
MRNKIAIDFDGTLIPQAKHYKEDETEDPFNGAVNFIRALAQKYDVVIFSARATTFKGKNAIFKWVEKNNLSSIITEVTCEKQYAFVAFVDDRAITFNSPNDYIYIAKGLGVEL